MQQTRATGSDNHGSAVEAGEVGVCSNFFGLPHTHMRVREPGPQRLAALCLLPPALLLCALLGEATAFAKDVKPASPSTPTQELELDFKGSFDLRHGGAALGKENKRGWAKNPTKGRQTAKREASVAKAKREKIVAAKPVKARPRNAYQQAFDSLRLRAAEISPAESGRAEVSFIVGKSGQPQRAAVHGISPLLDKALLEHLAGLRFPVEHSGQFYTSKITITASVTEAKANKTRHRNKRNRNKRNRNKPNRNKPNRK